MSIKIMSRVWESDMDSSRKLIMLAMADFADDSGGGIWPSIPTLAKKCSMGERTIQDHLANMRADGWLLIDGTKPVKGGQVNVYRINLAVKWCKSCTGADFAPVQKTAFSGAKSAPNPSVEPSERETRKRVLTLRTIPDNEMPQNLRNMGKPPKKRKPFVAGGWKGYDPIKENRHPSVKAYRRIFPKYKLTRDEVKDLACFRDTDRLTAVLTEWRKGVEARGWNPRNWRAIREKYDLMKDRAGNTEPKVGVVIYEPVYN